MKQRATLKHRIPPVLYNISPASQLFKCKIVPHSISFPLKQVKI